VAKLPSLGPLDVGIAIAHPCRERPDNSHMFQPFQLVGIVWIGMRGGQLLLPNSKGGIYGHITIGPKVTHLYVDE
jgi:hypothetical protein